METMTLETWLQNHQLRTLFGGTEIDSATQEALKNWFLYRELVDEDRFQPYFQRQVKMYQHQYNLLLRVETTQFDPMVSHYIEEEITRARESSGTAGDTTTQQSNGSRTTSRSGGEEVETGGTSRTTRTGTASTTRQNSGNDVVSTAGQTTTQGNGSTQSTEQTSRDRDTDAKTLTGVTPDSALYPANGGAPSALNWQYTSGQQEVITDEAETGQTTRSDTNSNREQTDDLSTVTTQHGLRVTETGETSGTDQGQTTGTERRTHNDGTEETDSGRVTTTKSGTTGESEEETERRRGTGREEAPQDMLERARQYISNANAFRWLVDKLDICFMGLFEY